MPQIIIGLGPRTTLIKPDIVTVLAPYFCPDEYSILQVEVLGKAPILEQVREYAHILQHAFPLAIFCMSIDRDTKVVPDASPEMAVILMGQTERPCYLGTNELTPLQAVRDIVRANCGAIPLDPLTNRTLLN